MLIQISNRCDMGCAHCLHDSRKDGGLMSLETFYKAVLWGYSQGCRFVLISGGEPTENPEMENMLQQFDRFGWNKGMRFAIVSNGTWIEDDEKRKMMKSSRPCKSWFMTPEDAMALESMQFPLTVWRAYDAQRYPDDTDPGISWTIDEKWCREYAASNRYEVKSRLVTREEIFAYVSRRGEEEMVIL